MGFFFVRSARILLIERTHSIDQQIADHPKFANGCRNRQYVQQGMLKAHIGNQGAQNIAHSTGNQRPAQPEGHPF